MENNQDKQAEKQELLDELSIPLRKPLKHGDREIYALELREPNAGEFERFMKLATTNAISALEGLISNITELPPAVVAKIGARDFNAAGRYLLPFFKTGLPTESSSSPN